MYAGVKGHVQYVNRPLRMEGIAANAKKEDGWTALMLASYNDQHQCVDCLLQNTDIERNAVNFEKETAPMLSRRTKHPNCVKRLLGERQIDVNIKDRNK